MAQKRHPKGTRQGGQFLRLSPELPAEARSFHQDRRPGGLGASVIGQIAQPHHLQDAPRFHPPADITSTDDAERELADFEEVLCVCETEARQADGAMSSAISSAERCEIPDSLVDWVRHTRIHLAQAALGIRRLRRRGAQWLSEDDPDNSPPPAHTDIMPRPIPAVLPGRVPDSVPDRSDADHLAKSLNDMATQIAAASLNMSRALIAPHRFGMTSDDIEWLREAQRRTSQAETGALLLAGWVRSCQSGGRHLSLAPVKPR